MDRLKIEYIPLGDLTPYENNARKHATEDVEAIKASIDAFGMNDPIAVWGKENIIIEGHGRLLALKDLGYKEAPCIRLDELSDDQRKAYALAHNKTAELSSWDFEKLEAELADLDGIIDMEELGFPMPGADVDIDGFFEDAEPKHKEPKLIKCPHCGEEFEQ